MLSCLFPYTAFAEATNRHGGRCEGAGGLLKLGCSKQEGEVEMQEAWLAIAGVGLVAMLLSACLLEREGRARLAILSSRAATAVCFRQGVRQRGWPASLGMEGHRFVRLAQGTPRQQG